MPSIPYRHYATQIGKRLRDNLNLGFQVGSNLSNYSYDATADLRARSRPRLTSSIVRGSGYSAPMRRRSYRRRSRRSMRRRSGMKRRGVKKYFTKTGRRATRTGRIARTVRSLKPIKYNGSDPSNFILQTDTGYRRRVYVYDPSVSPGVNNRDSSQTFVKMFQIKGAVGLADTISQPIMVCLVVRRRMTNTNTTATGYFLDSSGASQDHTRSGQTYGRRLNPICGIPVYKKWLLLSPGTSPYKTFDIKLRINEAVRQADLGSPQAGVEHYFDMFFVDNSLNTEPGTVATANFEGYYSFVDGA